MCGRILNKLQREENRRMSCFKLLSLKRCQSPDPPPLPKKEFLNPKFVFSKIQEKLNTVTKLQTEEQERGAERKERSLRHRPWREGKGLEIEESSWTDKKRVTAVRARRKPGDISLF